MSDAIEAARGAFVGELLSRQPGDEPYDLTMTIGEIEVYRLRRALKAAIDAYEAWHTSANRHYRTEPEPSQIP